MPFYYVANWKMNMHYQKAANFCSEQYESLIQLAAEKNAFLILCPSAVVLASVSAMFKETEIQIGAQDCSPFKEGAHTGDISAQSLMEAGASYCIIGHSERRIEWGETDEIIAQKMVRLFEVGIRPIICIGETKEAFDQGTTFEFLARQLDPLIEAIIQINSFSSSRHRIFIAYEPIWAIGSGIVPEKVYLESIFSWLKEYCTRINNLVPVRFLYGGSVVPEHIFYLKKVSGVEGFLIGGASIDFQMFKKIVVL